MAGQTPDYGTPGKEDFDPRIEDLARRIISECRVNLMMAFRFLDAALWKMPLVARELSKPISTDCHALYFNPPLVVETFRENPNAIVRTLLHSILHCVFRHPLVRERFEPGLWSLSCDVCIESIALEMLSERFALPDDGPRKNLIDEVQKALGTTTPMKVYNSLEKMELGIGSVNNVLMQQLLQFSESFRADSHETWLLRKREEESPEVPQEDGDQGDGDGDDGAEGSGNSAESGSKPDDEGDQDSGDGNSSQGNTEEEAGESPDDGGESDEEDSESSDGGEARQGGDQEEEGRSGSSEDEYADSNDDSGRAGANGAASEEDDEDGQDGYSFGKGDSRDEDDLSGMGAGNGTGSEGEGNIQYEEGELRDPVGPDHDEEDWERIAQQVQVDLETLSKRRGEGAGTLMANLELANRSTVDYEDFLRRFATMSEEMTLNDEEFDYIFYTYGINRYGNVALIEPLEYKDTKRVRDFVIAVDTSGSTEGELVRRFLTSTYEILCEASSFGSKVNIHIIQCDAEVRKDDKIEDLAQFRQFVRSFNVAGGGGTDFRPVFAYVNQLVEQDEFDDLQGLIYFTDGYGVFPERKPDYETAFVFVEENGEERRVPPWAMKVLITGEDIREMAAR
ncbi:MAG: DUF2201 family putative metallopeptidase [Coriobacteriales bacterium]|jgi:predicted metal-dependent peptidase